MPLLPSPGNVRDRLARRGQPRHNQAQARLPEMQETLHHLRAGGDGRAPRDKEGRQARAVRQEKNPRRHRALVHKAPCLARPD